MAVPAAAVLAGAVVVVWGCCAGKMCFAAAAPLPLPKAHRDASEDNGDASEIGTQSRVENSATFPHKMLSDQRFTNPLSPAVPSTAAAPRPLVKGDPEHINRHNNRPYQVQGIVPWTGRPPVLRGPQPMCVVPTIERDGTVIPREQRVSPGLGLFETPKIYVDAPVPGTAGTKGSAVPFFGAKMRRRSRTGSVAGSANSSVFGGTTAPATVAQPRLQWFHHLIHFTPIENSPGVSETDEEAEETSWQEEEEAEVEDGASVCPSEVPTVAMPHAGMVASVVAVPLAVRRHNDGGAQQETSVRSGGSRAPRPHETGGPRLHRDLPPPVPAANRTTVEQGAFGYYGAPVSQAEQNMQQQQQLQLSSHGASIPSLHEAEVPCSPQDPLQRTYSFGSRGSW